MTMISKRFSAALAWWGLSAALAGAAILPAAPAVAQQVKDLKVGVVDLRQAVVNSSAGERIKKILMASKDQKETQLKDKEQNLKQRREALKNNIMLNEEARKAREAKLREEEQAFRKEVRTAQRELQQRERKLTESTVIELKTVIQSIAEQEGYDLVLEESFSQVILYAGAKVEDITDKVIERYNRLQAGQ